MVRFQARWERSTGLVGLGWETWHQHPIVQAATGEGQSRGRAWGSAPGRGGWWAGLCPPGVCMGLPRGAQHMAGLRVQPSWKPSRRAGQSGHGISHCRVKHFDNHPAEIQQNQVIFTAAAPACCVSWYFANPVVFGIKTKEGNQKTKPWACLKCRALGFSSDTEHEVAWPQWWQH